MIAMRSYNAKAIKKFLLKSILRYSEYQLALKTAQMPRIVKKCVIFTATFVDSPDDCEDSEVNVSALWRGRKDRFSNRSNCKSCQRFATANYKICQPCSKSCRPCHRELQLQKLSTLQHVLGSKSRRQGNLYTNDIKTNRGH